jgi:hypothetical protein
MCPKLEELEIAECSPGLVGDSLFSSERTVRSLLLGERGGGGGLKKLVMRECGVKDLGGLEAVARELSHGGAEGWRCEEIDLRDNGVEKVYFPSRHSVLALSIMRKLTRVVRCHVWCSSTPSSGTSRSNNSSSNETSSGRRIAGCGKRMVRFPFLPFPLYPFFNNILPCIRRC